MTQLRLVILASPSFQNTMNLGKRAGVAICQTFPQCLIDGFADIAILRGGDISSDTMESCIVPI
jgi:hypothetical protein